MAPAIPDKTYRKISDKAKAALCRVVSSEGLAGTGAIYNLDAGTEQPTIFAICKHVLSKHSALKGKTELHFTEVEALKNVTLKDGWIAFSWESEEFDVTIVELTASAVAELKEKNAKSLTINPNQIRVDRSGQPIEFDTEADSDNKPLKLAIVQYTTYDKYNKNAEFSFDKGIAKAIDGVFMIYRIETTPGSSGSPVLNWEGEAVALHQGAWTEELEIPEQYIAEISYKRRGVMWQAILPAFFAARTEFKNRHW